VVFAFTIQRGVSDPLAAAGFGLTNGASPRAQ